MAFISEILFCIYCSLILIFILRSSHCRKLVSSYFTNSNRTVQGVGLPGPSLLQVGLQFINESNVLILLQNLCRKYGNVISLKIGCLDLVVVDSHDAVRNLLAKDEASERRVDASFKDRNFGKNIGLILSYGEKQAEMKRFVLQSFKKNGFNDRRTMEGLIIYETDQLIQHIAELSLENKKGVVHFNPDFFMIFALNLVSHIVTGERYQFRKDSSFGHMFKTASLKYTKAIGNGNGIYNIFPFLTKYCPRIVGYNKLLEAIKECHTLARDVLHANHNNTAHTASGSFLEEYLQRMNYPGNDFPLLNFNEEEFIVTFLDVMQAGVDPLTINLGFAIHFLTLHRNVQEELANEIHSVVGNDRFPSILDEQDMVFAKAVVLEILRCAKTLAFIPRSAGQDFMINNRLVKKDSTIICCNYSTSMNPEVWGDPESFRPRRFITSAGAIDKNLSDNILIFGAGKRACFGEGLARDALFLVMTSLVQKFTFQLVKDEELALFNKEPSYSYTFNPPAYDCVVVPRAN